MRAVLAFAAALCFALPALADSPRISHDARELGRVILRELSVRDGQLVIRTDSNGCTQKSSFRVEVRKAGSFTPGVPNYSLSIERIVADECKALEWDGVQIAFDLAKDLGLSGDYTVSIENPVLWKKGQASFSSVPPEGGDDLRKPLLQATARAIEREIAACRARLKTAEAGTGPKENVEKLTTQLSDLQGERARYSKMQPEDYPAPALDEPDAGAVFDRAADIGPVLPPVQRQVTGSVEETPKEGALLSVKGASRSGPFYHLAGIKGDDYTSLVKGKQYQFDVFLVYKRSYFSFIPDYYVFVSAAR